MPAQLWYKIHVVYMDRTKITTGRRKNCIRDPVMATAPPPVSGCAKLYIVILYASVASLAQFVRSIFLWVRALSTTDTQKGLL